MKRLAAILLSVCTFSAIVPAAAGVTVDVDKATLNSILGAVAVTEVEVEIADGQTLAVELHDLEVTGLEPASVNGKHDMILTAVTVVAPELGLRLPLQPRIAVEVQRENGRSILELRFDDLSLAVPLLGQFNLARMVPPMRYPADNMWILAGARGDVPVTSRLADVQMGRETIRFEFDVEVSELP